MYLHNNKWDFYMKPSPHNLQFHHFVIKRIYENFHAHICFLNVNVFWFVSFAIDTLEKILQNAWYATMHFATTCNLLSFATTSSTRVSFKVLNLDLKGTHHVLNQNLTHSTTFQA